jgi:hypothetical protein
MRLQPDDTRDDPRIQQTIDFVSAAMLRHLGRSIVLNEDEEEVTEYHDGEGRFDLPLNEFPVISITSVHDSPDRAYAAGDLLTAGTDYVVESTQHGSALRRVPGGAFFSLVRGFETQSFFPGVRNVRVIYVPGYATRADLPQDLVGVAVTETVAWMTKQQHAGTTRMQAGDLAEDYDLSAWRPESLAVMARHRRIL